MVHTSAVIRELVHIALLATFLYVVLGASITATAVFVGVVALHTAWLTQSWITPNPRMASIVTYLGVLAVATAGIVAYWPNVAWTLGLLLLVAVWLLVDILAGTAPDLTDRSGTDSDDRIQLALMMELRRTLGEATEPLTAEELASSFGVDTERVRKALSSFDDDLVYRTNGGYVLDQQELGFGRQLRRAGRRFLEPFRLIRSP